jgi:hypothetical protein
MEMHSASRIDIYQELETSMQNKCKNMLMIILTYQISTELFHFLEEGWICIVSGKKLKKYAATFFFQVQIHLPFQITITTTSQQMRLNFQQQLEVVGLWLPVYYLYVIIGFRPHFT